MGGIKNPTHTFLHFGQDYSYKGKSPYNQKRNLNEIKPLLF
uniref:Uncharacterized protein n=1 Tax=Siphoviridae sp. ctYh54 TaxID=2826379 RepID=A0A8S5MEB2_9CAUD|nr:MAG TPA: hypothetical protein [Siphoviridae sp. ctYh54]